MNQLLTTVFERMISVKRPYEGFGEGAALAWLHREVVPLHAVTWIDGAGNLHIDTREDKFNRTLFIAHVDTMHHVEGANEFVKDDTGFYRAKGAPLGADDGAGVAILSVLMHSIPAYYIFCRGEERGGVGSRYIAENYPQLLKGFDRAIAFDRAGYTDVITHQAGGRCASDKFAEALSDQFNDLGLLYMPSDLGVYTDTAEFTMIIPECTNISVGYDHQHGDKELQDGNYLHALCEAALNVDWDSLPIERTPGDEDVAALFDEFMFPPVWNDHDEDTKFAVFDAIDGRPDELIALVAKRAEVSMLAVDSTVFTPAEVLSIAEGSRDWDDVIEALMDQAVPYLN